MIDRSATIAGMLIVALVVLGCGGSSAVGSSPPSVASPVVAQASVPAGPSDSMMPASSPAVGDAPPDATLAAEGGDPVTGQLGSYTWADGGSDSPWLPGAPLKAAAGEPLTMSLAGDIGIDRWTASRVPAGAEGGPGVSGLGSGTGSPVTFDTPGAGAWSIQVTIEFGGGLGSASYYWRLDVT